MDLRNLGPREIALSPLPGTGTRATGDPFMTNELVTGVAAGAGIGAVYVLSAYLMFRFSLSRGQRMFLIVALGGIGIRLLVAVSVITLILVLTSVNQPAFLGGFFAVFVLGLILEIVLLHRGQLAASQHAGDPAGPGSTSS